MFSSSYRIATVFGIPIKLHISLLLMVLLLVHRFGWLWGIFLEAGLATSIVLHELGHSLVAIRKGCRVREITLLCLGGAAQMERIPTRPGDEFAMAVAGPAVSLALGGAGLFGGAYLPLPNVPGWPWNAVQMLGIVNVGLVLFNLLPSFPMDGGRILRAILSRKLGRLRATFIASRLGRIMAVLFGIHGFATQNWILVFIAFFIFSVAGKEYRMVEAEEAMRRQGLDTWSTDGGPAPGWPDDQVVISPPPYRGGRSTRAPVHADDEPGISGGAGW